MSKKMPPPDFHLHFEGAATAGHIVPASALVQAVQGLQRAIYLLAAAREGYDFKQRVRITHELERKYAVTFKVPQDGGYDIPYSIGGAAERFFDTDDVAVVTDQYLASLEAVQNNDYAALKRIIPLAPFRKGYISALKNMQPPPRSGLVVSLENARRQKLLDGKTAVSRLAPMLQEPEAPKVQPRTITGRLDAIDFQARSLTLQLYSGRQLKCRYAEDFEPILLENAREWIQVRGEAVLGEDDRLEALNNVDGIAEVDETDLPIDAISVGDLCLTANAPVTFRITFDPEDGFYTAEGDFNIVVSAETRAELEQAVCDSIAFLWREYVKVSAKLLSLDAVELRRKLSNQFSEAPNAD